MDEKTIGQMQRLKEQIGHFSIYRRRVVLPLEKKSLSYHFRSYPTLSVSEARPIPHAWKKLLCYVQPDCRASSKSFRPFPMHSALHPQAAQGTTSQVPQASAMWTRFKTFFLQGYLTSKGSNTWLYPPSAARQSHFQASNTPNESST